MSPPSPANFDPLARPYRFLEYLTFGRALERARLHLLPRLTTCRRALILGDGDGRFTQRLLRSNPDLTATAIDGSSDMLHELRRRCATDQHRLVTHQAHLPEVLAACIAGQTFDLVATLFFLDCLTTAEVALLARTLRPHLATDAFWI
ncbi:MAG: class I SAM-dependent methyltransferase, partial [Acidobacteriota bacterium]|nr:class I SAM-dependent methyltransferase [Acidobacteriota bacterium]